MKILAYIDSTCGLCKCHVIAAQRVTGGWSLTARVTDRNHPIYKPGELIEFRGTMIVPRDKVRRYRGLYFPRILPYDWADYITE